MDLKDRLAEVAGKIGAPVIKSILTGSLGPVGGELAGQVIDRIAAKVGQPPDDIILAPENEIHDAIRQVEAETPELLALWQRGVEGQHALLLAETREGFWQSFWRWGWMYLLAFFWLWRIVILPVTNRLIPPPAIEAIDLAILMTLTSWFIALYMGGDTLKELGKNAADALKTARRNG